MNVQVGPIYGPYLRQVIDQLRLGDRETDIMNHCTERSTSIWIGVVDDKLACLWGVVPPSLLSNRAYLWLYHTDEVKEHPFAFIRRSQIAVQELLEEYDILVGHTKIGNDNSHRWLKWLGAEFGYPNGDFIPFEIRKK